MEYSLFEQAFDAMQDGVVITNADFIIVYVNNAVTQKTGWAKADLIGKTPKIFQCPETDVDFKNTIKETISHGMNFIGQTVNRRKDDTRYYVELYISPIKDNAGNITHYIGTQRDIADRETNRFKEFFEKSNSVLMNLDLVGETILVRHLNKQAEELFGIGDANGRKIKHAFKNLDEMLGQIQVCVDSKQMTHTEQIIGDQIVDFSFIPVFDAAGKLIMVNGVGEIITNVKQALDHIHYLAYHDNLTGLPNRLMFQERLEVEIERAHRKKSTFAVLFIDLDKFKQVNDTFGHGKGDVLLKQVATRLSQCIRKPDLVARLGGDEFALIMTSGNDVYTEVDELTKRIIKIITRKFEVEGIDVNLGISIGAAIYPEHGTDAQTLVSKSDTAMYHAKRSGGNVCTTYMEVFNVANA